MKNISCKLSLIFLGLLQTTQASSTCSPLASMLTSINLIKCLAPQKNTELKPLSTKFIEEVATVEYISMLSQKKIDIMSGYIEEECRKLKSILHYAESNECKLISSIIKDLEEVLKELEELEEYKLHEAEALKWQERIKIKVQKRLKAKKEEEEYNKLSKEDQLIELINQLDQLSKLCGSLINPTQKEQGIDGSHSTQNTIESDGQEIVDQKELINKLSILIGRFNKFEKEHKKEVEKVQIKKVNLIKDLIKHVIVQAINPLNIIVPIAAGEISASLCGSLALKLSMKAGGVGESIFRSIGKDLGITTANTIIRDGLDIQKIAKKLSSVDGILAVCKDALIPIVMISISSGQINSTLGQHVSHSLLGEAVGTVLDVGQESALHLIADEKERKDQPYEERISRVVRSLPYRCANGVIKGAGAYGAKKLGDSMEVELDEQNELMGKIEPSIDHQSNTQQSKDFFNKKNLYHKAGHFFLGGTMATGQKIVAEQQHQFELKSAYKRGKITKEQYKALTKQPSKTSYPKTFLAGATGAAVGQVVSELADGYNNNNTNNNQNEREISNELKKIELSPQQEFYKRRRSIRVSAYIGEFTSLLTGAMIGVDYIVPSYISATNSVENDFVVRATKKAIKKLSKKLIEEEKARREQELQRAFRGADYTTIAQTLIEQGIIAETQTEQGETYYSFIIKDEEGKKHRQDFCTKENALFHLLKVFPELKLHIEQTRKEYLYTEYKNKLKRLGNSEKESYIKKESEELKKWVVKALEEKNHIALEDICRRAASLKKAIREIKESFSPKSFEEINRRIISSYFDGEEYRYSISDIEKESVKYFQKSKKYIDLINNSKLTKGDKASIYYHLKKLEKIRTSSQEERKGLIPCSYFDYCEFDREEKSNQRKKLKSIEDESYDNIKQIRQILGVENTPPPPSDMEDITSVGKGSWSSCRDLGNFLFSVVGNISSVVKFQFESKALVAKCLIEHKLRKQIVEVICRVYKTSKENPSLSSIDLYKIAENELLAYQSEALSQFVEHQQLGTKKIIEITQKAKKVAYGVVKGVKYVIDECKDEWNNPEEYRYKSNSKIEVKKMCRNSLHIEDPKAWGEKKNKESLALLHKVGYIGTEVILWLFGEEVISGKIGKTGKATELGTEIYKLGAKPEHLVELTKIAIETKGLEQKVALGRFFGKNPYLESAFLGSCMISEEAIYKTQKLYSLLSKKLINTEQLIEATRIIGGAKGIEQKVELARFIVKNPLLESEFLKAGLISEEALDKIRKGYILLIQEVASVEQIIELTKISRKATELETKIEFAKFLAKNPNIESSLLRPVLAPKKTNCVNGAISKTLRWGKNSKGHLIKHREILGYSHKSAQEAQKILPQLKVEINKLFNNAKLTRIGRWESFQCAKFYICEGKMIVTRKDGTFITIINKTSNNWFQKATLVKNV